MARTRAILRHGWRHGWRGVALVSTFVSSTFVGLSLHGDLPPVRRLAARIGNDVLADLFEGRIVIEEVESLTIAPRSRVRVARASIVDAQGRPLIVASGIEADIRLDRLLASILRHETPVVDIGDARIEDAHVTLDREADGTIGLVRALRPKPTPGGQAPSGGAKTENVVLHIDRALVRHAQVRGNIVPPELDGDADDVRARVAIEHDIFTVDLDAARTTLRSPRIPGQRGSLRADATGKLTLPLAETTELTAYVDLRGDVGGIPLALHAGIAKDQVDGTIDVARADPEAVTKVFPSVRLTKPLEIHAKAEGKLPSIGLRANVRAGDAELKAEGEIDVREGHAFRLDVDAAHLDAALAGGPASDLTGRVHVDGNLSEPPSARFRATTTDGKLAGQNVPPVVLEGRLEGSKVTSTFRATEPGIDASGKLVLDIPRNDLALDVQARSTDLSKLARLPVASAGAASVRVLGNIDVKQGAIHARATADGEALRVGPFGAGRARAEAMIIGLLSAPVLDVTASGDDVRLQSEGKQPLSYPHATAHARVTLVPVPRVSDAELHVGEPGGPETVTARAESIELRPGGVAVRGVRVTGLGAPIEADVDVAGRRWTVRAKASDVDLERAAALTGIAQLRLLPQGSRATLDVDVSSDGSGATGHADLAVKSERGIDAEGHFRFADRHVTGRARASVAGLGFVEVPSAEIDLPGPPDARAFERATGTVEVRGEIDLAQVGGGLAGEKVEQTSGIAVIEGRIERGDPTALPALRGTVTTRGLEITLTAPEGVARPVLRGVEASAHVAYDGRTDDAEVALLAWDARGVLASADVKAHVPLRRLVNGDRAAAYDTIVHAPLAGVFDIPERGLDQLPSVLFPARFAGTIQARGTLEGALVTPELRFGARAVAVREKRTRRRAQYEPIDAALEGRWNGEHLVALLSADERERPPTRPGVVGAVDDAQAPRDRPAGRLRAMVLGQVRAEDVLASRPGHAPPWSASAEVDVDHLELAPMPLPTRVQGALTGRAKLVDLGSGTPSFEANAHVDRFAVSGARIEAIDGSIGARDGSLFASARATERGRATLEVTVASRALRWRGVTPGWDARELTRVDYVASGLRLALLRPFARQEITDLDGRLDGRGSAMFDATSQTFEGGLALSEGRVYVRSLGEDVSDVKGVARFERSGVFRIDDATGKVDLGEFRASATGRMQGLRFVGANATIIVPSKKGIPLSSEGVSYAEATGEVRLEARMSDDRQALLVTVDVPRADLDLPRREAPTLQLLEPDKHIEVGIRRPNGKLEPILEDRRRAQAAEEEQPITTRFTVVLGNQVTLEGQGLNVQLGGKTVIEIAQEVTVTGRIDLRGGSIEVHGRRFTIDRGSVTFPEGGEPSNPTVVASAYWDAPDRTRIWVEFAGPLKSGSLTLRSEPAYSKNEILSILLFGRPDPNMATAGQRPTEAGTGQATAIGSGFVATDINRALAELDENLQIETDTLSGNRTRTKVGYRIGRTLRLQVGYAPGQSYREPDTTFAFLDWQFLPKWSLLATQGNRGTSILDVIFQHRY